MPQTRPNAWRRHGSPEAVACLRVLSGGSAMKIRLSGFERQTLAYVLFCVGTFSPSTDPVDDDGQPDLQNDNLPDLVISPDEHQALLSVIQKVKKHGLSRI
jgi:hypothetical protein